MTLPVLADAPPCGVCRCAAKARKPEPKLVEALLGELSANCCGRENAATWDQLLRDLNRYPYVLEVKVARRLQEAAEVLREEGYPIVGLSSGGIFLARTVDELDEAIAEKRKRARSSFHSLRLLKRARSQMLGQAALDLSTAAA
jgi:hypothetical protein